MIILICGTPGSGKSVAARLVAKKLKYKHYSIGGLMREMAEEKGMTYLEFSELCNKNRSYDEELDQRQIQLGRNEDNFVIDSHLGFHFIPKSIKIFLDADFETRAKRILSDRIRKEHNVDLENTKERINLRVKWEKERWGKYYNLDPYDKSNFEYIIDTTNLPPEEVADKIIEFVKTKCL